MFDSVTREELYEKVWTAPLNRVAAEIGVSAARVVSACKTFGIPRPGQGHWQLAADGRRAPPPLPPPDPRMRNAVAFDVHSMHIPVPKLVDTALRSPKPGDGLDHPLIRQAYAALSAVEADDEQRLTPLGAVLSIRPTKDTLERALLVMARVIRHAEANNWAVTVEPRADRGFGGWPTTASHATLIRVDGREIAVSVAERLRIPQDPATATKRPTEDLADSSRILWFRIHSMRGTGGRNKWVDKPSAPLEDQVAEIARGLASVPAAVAQREEAERAYQASVAHAYRDQHEREASTREQEKRRARLFELAELHRSATQIRELVAAAEREHRGNDELQRWASWARDVANQLDPVTASNALDLLTTTSHR